MMKKKEEKIIERLRELVNKHNELLVISELLGISLDEESEILKDILYEHPDMIKEFFNGEEIELEDGTVMDPSIHITFEAICQYQISNSSPPEASELYLLLLKNKVDPHLARHKVWEILLDVIWDIMSGIIEEYPESYYESKLRKEIFNLRNKN